MSSQWRVPTQAEQARGFVAICLVMENIRKYGKNGVVGEQAYLRSYYYKQEHLERRANYSTDLPEFWSGPQADSSDAWLNYIATGEASKEVAKILPTLGSYRSAA